MSDAVHTIHDGLPREGPGDRESLDWALAVARPPRNGRVLDAGCGSGADIAGLLAHVPDGRVVAMDCHAPFAARAAAAHAGCARVQAVVGDMARPEGRFDLIWSAGAVYFLGVTEALTGWRNHLVPGGRVAFSQIAWRTEAPDAAARAFWRDAYPQMTDRAGVLMQAAAAGYRVLADRFLPDAAWDEFYRPLEVRVAGLRAAGAASPDLVQGLDESTREIALWRSHGADYGYLQVVAARDER